ncbi:acyltransferase domain-containing protein [Streptomyces sp. ventii]|uniref:Acyltransferase domain-containing protein n=2 Tax=Streptomyces spiramenti TaxID=2720606 RepID=A0ABX1AKT4_9ACTN|nr:acyltransferase domain-containing protein [Streptomyces spiramenti]
MAFRFPGADTPEELWRIIRDGEDRVVHFPEERLRAAGVPESTYRAEGFVGATAPLDDIAGFDAAYFGITGREAEVVEPQQRLFLECAHHALEDSGYGRERPGTRTGVFAATGSYLYPLQNYLLNNVLPDGVEEDWLSRLQVLLGTHPDFNATRTAFRLGLTGPAVGVQTACSSSLVAVQLAAQSVLVGDCDIALAGAAAVHVPQVLGYRYVKGSILSRSGRLRAFDADADGTVAGNGVAAVVLKPLRRALADGDTVHGVIRGWGVTNDGADKRAFTAPSARGQERAIRRALDRAGVGAGTVGYLEAHGTGTFKGDPIEFAGATAAFRHDTERTGYCALGSTKSNLGHLDTCSGLASLIKSLLVLKHATIPPLANFNRPNPTLELDTSPFWIPREAVPWPASDTPRRAGVTSLGVGGTNVHLVVEEAPAPTPRGARGATLGALPLSGHTPAALTANVRAFHDHLRRHPGTDVADLLTSTAGRAVGPFRAVAQGDTATGIADALHRWLDDDAPADGAGPAEPERPPRAPRVGLLFSGQGGARPTAVRALYERYSAVREVLDHCDRLHRERSGRPLLAPLLAPGDPEVPWPTDAAQPALYAVQCALTALWRRAGVVPEVVAGHSVGEFAALTAAGALTVEDGLWLTAERGRLMESRCAPGGMVAVLADGATASALAAEVPGIEQAAVNGERNRVLAGPRDAVGRLRELLAERNVPHRPLPVAHAFHTALLEPALPEFGTLLARVAFSPVTLPFVSGLDGAVREPGWTPDADYLLRQARRPVLFHAALREVAAHGATALLEVGGGGLAGLARQALPDVVAVATLRGGAGLDPLRDAAAALHRAGAPIDWHELAEGGGGRRIPLPGYRFQHRTHWKGPEPTAAAAAEPPREGTDMAAAEAEVREVLTHVVEVTSRALGDRSGSVGQDTSFLDLGADSLLMINVLRELEQTYRVKVAMRELFDEAVTPRLLAELVAGRRVEAAGPAAPPAPVSPAPPAPAPAPAAAPIPAAVPDPEPAAVAAPVAVAPAAPVATTTPPPQGGVAAGAPDAPGLAAATGDWATRQEVEELTRQVRQLSAIQLQLMEQLAQLLSRQVATAPAGEQR